MHTFAPGIQLLKLKELGQYLCPWKRKLDCFLNQMSDPFDDKFGLQYQRPWFPSAFTWPAAWCFLLCLLQTEFPGFAGQNDHFSKRYMCRTGMLPAFFFKVWSSRNQYQQAGLPLSAAHRLNLLLNTVELSFESHEKPVKNQCEKRDQPAYFCSDSEFITVWVPR